MNGVIWWDGKPVPISKFAELLEIEQTKKREEENPPPE